MQENLGNKGFAMFPETKSTLARQSVRDESILSLPAQVLVANQNTRFLPSLPPACLPYN